MDQTQLQEKIALYYNKLPEQTKVLFAGMSWLETLKEIETKYLLDDSQIKTLGTETTLLLLGIVNLDDYEKTLRMEIKIPEIQMDEIINEIGEKIIKDIAPLVYESFNKNVSDLMKEKYGDKIDERISQLPEKIKEAINNSGYQTSIYEIGNKYSLNIHQIGQLEEITTKVMVGVLNPNKYEEEIKSNINTPPEKLVSLINEINEKVFKNIKGILMEIWTKKDTANVPLPPYMKKDILEVPIPTKKEISIEEEKVVENNIYKESGIEILSDNTPLENKGVSKEISTNNIVTDKLFGKTINNTTVTDYTVTNKIKELSNEKEEATTKPHDPYHEVI